MQSLYAQIPLEVPGVYVLGLLGWLGHLDYLARCVRGGPWPPWERGGDAFEDDSYAIKHRLGRARLQAPPKVHGDHGVRVGEMQLACSD